MKIKHKLAVIGIITAMLSGCGHTEKSSDSVSSANTEKIPPITVVKTETEQSESSISEAAVSNTTEPKITSAETASATAASVSTETENVSETSVSSSEIQEHSLTEETSAQADAPEETGQAERYDTFYGVLIDEDCSDFEYPPLHDLPCMLMDSCRASGYGLDIEQSDGSWVFYMFDDNGQTLSWDYLTQTDRMDGLYVTVTGKWEDNVIKVIDLQEG